MKIRNSWKEIGEKSNYKKAAAYKIHLVNKKGEKVHIKRFVGTDTDGVLCIGSTNNMDVRLKKFIYSRKTGKKGHSEAQLLNLIESFNNFKQRYKNYKLQYCFWEKPSKKKAKKEEERLIKKYVKKFGEVPPLNSLIPNKQGDWNKY